MKKLCTFALATITAMICFSTSLFAGEISLFAAASMKDVMNEVTDSYTKKNPGVTFKKNYGASGALAKQIENGAPADIVITASLEWMEHMKSARLVDVKSADFLAFNVLVFAGKPELKVSGLKDILALSRIAIGSPGSVPAGDYAMDAFRKAGIDKQLQGRLVLAKDVRECLMYAERGEVDGAFVYKTDVQQAAKTAKILFTVPQQLYPRVSYPMALTVEGSKNKEVTAFFTFLYTNDVKNALKKHGFLVK